MNGGHGIFHLVLSFYGEEGEVKGGRGGRSNVSVVGG